MKRKRIGKILSFAKKKIWVILSLIILKLLNQQPIFNSLNAKSDKCGREFFYRRDGTRFDKSHVQIKDRSGKNLSLSLPGFPQALPEISSVSTENSYEVRLLFKILKIY